MVLCFWAEQGCNLLRQGIHTLWCVSHTGVAVGTASWHIVAAMSFGQGHCLHSPLWLGEIVICSGRGFTHWWCVSLSSGSNEFWAGIDLAGILHYG